MSPFSGLAIRVGSATLLLGIIHKRKIQSPSECWQNASHVSYTDS